MSFEAPLVQAETIRTPKDEAYIWLAQTLTHFAEAEQALGKLALSLGFSIENGSLGSLEGLRERLRKSDSKACKQLDKRIARWLANRPYRHLLAHSTITLFLNEGGSSIVATRHLPRDEEDVTPDKVWSPVEREDLRKNVAMDGRSICDLTRNILSDPKLLDALRTTKR